MGQSVTSSSTYTGRFAPTPSGPLHFGSLIAAMGSYLQAKTNRGSWLLRVEDIDPPREQAGASEAILNCLETYGFEWDGSVSYQSENTERYEYYLAGLKGRSQTYACDCTRKAMLQTARRSPSGYVYGGKCRFRNLQYTENRAVRLRMVSPNEVTFKDQIQGRFCQNLADQVGDFTLKRRDGLYSYQLAVVVDDYEQGVTEVVRGMDLMDNTPRQIYLQRKLGFSAPAYLHLPLALNKTGDKLSKQTSAAALNLSKPVETLFAAWHFLGQAPLNRSEFSEDPRQFWDAAAALWDTGRIPTSQNGFIIENNSM